MRTTFLKVSTQEPLRGIVLFPKLNSPKLIFQLYNIPVLVSLPENSLPLSKGSITLFILHLFQALPCLLPVAIFEGRYLSFSPSAYNHLNLRSLMYNTGVWEKAGTYRIILVQWVSGTKQNCLELGQCNWYYKLGEVKNFLEQDKHLISIKSRGSSGKWTILILSGMSNQLRGGFSSLYDFPQNLSIVKGEVYIY